MKKEIHANKTRQRMLDVAEDLFTKRGYAAVKLRDIADALAVRHASLYYYLPGGKEQLFVEVVERNFVRHRQGLEQAIASSKDLRAQVHAIADWITSQPPLSFSRMHEADMPAIGTRKANQLTQLGYDTFRLPIVAMLERARAGGKVDVPNLDLAAMALVSLLQSVHTIPLGHRTRSITDIGREVADMLLNGWLRR